MDVYKYSSGYCAGQFRKSKNLPPNVADEDIFLAAIERGCGICGRPITTKQQALVGQSANHATLVGHIRWKL